MTDNLDSLRWLAEQGARFALPYGRSKDKFEDGWPKKPHTVEEAIAHAGRGGNVGVLTGEYSGGIVAIDRDVNFPHTCEMLGDLARTAKIVRDNAPSRGKLLYRVQGTLPPSTVWKEAITDKHPSCEFLAKGRHALTDPSSYDGGHYRLIDTQYGIQEITLTELDYIWRLITGGSLNKERRAREDAEQIQDGNDDFVRQVKSAWPVKSVFEHWRKAANGTASERGETRVLGNAGLLISENGQTWYCHGEGIGGDNLDAWAFCRWNKRIDRTDGKMFWDVVNDMAGVVGIKREVRTNGNGAHRTYQAEQPQFPNEPAVEGGTDGPYLLLEGISDEGNARCVKQLYPNTFLYTEAQGWLSYTGTHWTAKGAEAIVNRSIVDTLTSRIKAALSSDPEKHDKLIKFCIPNKGRVQGAIYLLESSVASDIDEFDAEPDLLNCKNGVVDLRTGLLSPHSSSQKFTHCTTVDYRPNADVSPFLAWLTEAVKGGKETVDWLQMAIGYSLTGHTKEEVLFYLYGPPRSGKGTLTEMLLALLGGTLAKEVNFGTFTAQRTGDSQNFDLAPLKPCRMVMASESNAYERFNEAKVKMLTGGNEVYCAFKHQTHFGYKPQYKIWLSSNQPVNADPDDDAVWGRLRVIEFPHSHLGIEDKTLKARMRSTDMLEGVLAWAVQGAMRWYALGKVGLPELTGSAVAKSEHRSELDNVQAWFDECCEPVEGFTSYSVLYQSYEEWCKHRGVEPKKQKGFSQSLIRKGYVNKLAKIDGRMIRGFTGLRVR